ncbi:hypothetical protein BST11_01450 [Mycobacterium alsense]|uniref:Uncharacterized protein n=1 Tax=Mycobacterium alsense TaxID=324058 RepID=A0AA42BY13_9MYCO|nr:hypothetical protein [Mycobacterium alsense]MCV7378207.1 hypothetical protein [Mycobacterium alsense]OQZ93325.1 hypothetical protein BST11_01450 [Mycobacterium alsense]
MATPTIDISHNSRVAAARAARADGEGLRYRLDVVASSPADVVRSAGGFLYDRVMAGWQVNMLLPHGCDTRPLRILGVRALDPQAASAGSTTHSLAVSAEAFAADAQVRDKVLECLDDRLTEVALWGDGWPLAVNRAMTRAQHVLSAAARRFKGHALAAAEIDCDTVDPTEPLLCDKVSRLPVDSGLIPLD